MEDNGDMIVDILSFDDVVLEPVISLLVDVFDEERIEGIDISDKDLPFLLELSLDLTGVLSGGLQEAAEVLLFVVHVFGSFTDLLSEGKVRFAEELLAGVDDDLLSVAGNASHPRGVVHSHVSHDESQHQPQ